ncbi:MAG: hypothetical protein FWE15_30150 [Actinomycetia bacterium]|nr:hypothetical protein [Actinomycetes bacterium]
MTKFLLAVHVLAAVMAVGPVAVAASMFPPALRRARAGSRGIAGSGDAGKPRGPGDAGSSADGSGGDAPATLRTLHRICRVYAGVGLAVPVFGFATASSLGVLGSGWLIASIVLTAAAAGVLALLILPAQSDALARSGTDSLAGTGTDSLAGTSANSLAAPARLAMLTGVFNLLWATVTVLMIVRPGSTTGV